jgi:WD40 repeat protein
VRHHSHAGHFDEIQSIEWSSDSRFFLTASKDLTARMWSLNPEEGFVPTTLGGHRQGVVGAWFSKDQETVGTTAVLFSPRTDLLMLNRSIRSVRTVRSSSGNTWYDHMLRRMMR